MNSLKLTLTASVLILGALLTIQPARAQFANSALNGNYYFRYLGVNSAVNPSAAISALGTLMFDGMGKFTVTGQQLTHNPSGADSPIAVSVSGTYSLLTSGVIVMSNPFAPIGINLYGGTSADGVLIGSSTESPVCDFFVAIPTSTNTSNTTLKGTYQFASLEFLGGDFAGSSRDTFFPITADGNGGLGTVAVKGTAINLGHQASTQTSSEAIYSISANGSGTITFPAASLLATADQLIAGTKTLYVSSDGNLILGGSATGFDMFLGVKAMRVANSTDHPLSGLFFTSYLSNDNDPDYPGPYAEQGSHNDISNSLALIHHRINYPGYPPYDQTYSTESFGFQSDGTAVYSFEQSAIGAGGKFLITTGNSSTYTLGLVLKAPALSGPGVFLNPQGVVNAASSIPFTARVSPGEVLALYGTGLTSQTLSASSLPFPLSLGGVSATINGSPAPIQSIYHSTPFDSVSVVVPYTLPTDGSGVIVQVNNNGTPSNPVMAFTGLTQPGVFTTPAGGIGNGAILHADYRPVSPDSPAKIGETVQIYLTGLGPVQPPIPAGWAARVSPLSLVPDSTEVQVFIDGVEAKVSFMGLAPTVAGLYQLNVTIPAGITTGASVDLEIVTKDADNTEATIPIAKTVGLQAEGVTFSTSLGFSNCYVYGSFDLDPGGVFSLCSPCFTPVLLPLRNLISENCIPRHCPTPISPPCAATSRPRSALGGVSVPLVNDEMGEIMEVGTHPQAR